MPKPRKPGLGIPSVNLDTKYATSLGRTLATLSNRTSITSGVALDEHRYELYLPGTYHRQAPTDSFGPFAVFLRYVPERH